MMNPIKLWNRKGREEKPEEVWCSYAFHIHLKIILSNYTVYYFCYKKNFINKNVVPLLFCMPRIYILSLVFMNVINFVNKFQFVTVSNSEKFLPVHINSEL